MLIPTLLVVSAAAGDIFAAGGAAGLYSLDTREVMLDALGGFSNAAGPVYIQESGGSYNSITNTFVVGGCYPSPCEVFSVDVRTGRTSTVPVAVLTEALAFDSGTATMLAVGDRSGSGVWDMFSGTLLFDPGVRFAGADWFDDGGYIVGREVMSGDFYRVQNGMTVRLASSPTGMTGWSGGLAYDRDTRLFWWFGANHADVWLIEPQTWSVVGLIYTLDLFDGAGGSIDTVLPQTPELLVTGACPGTVYLTVVDATPGQHVQFASGTTPGTRTVRRGPCAGVQGDLQNPTPRFDLIANDYGIASTTIQATAPMCGAGLVQAIDVATCLTTSVRTIPDGPLMLSL
jgi:hypothetical protein